MRRRILHAIHRTEAPEAVYERVRASDDLLGVRFTPEEIIFPVRLHREYMPYADVVWAYLYVKETEMATGEFDGGCIVENRLVLYAADGSNVSVRFDRTSYGQHALELVSRAAPHIAIGFTPENRKRFPFAAPKWQR